MGRASVGDARLQRRERRAGEPPELEAVDPTIEHRQAPVKGGGDEVGGELAIKVGREFAVRHGAINHPAHPCAARVLERPDSTREGGVSKPRWSPFPAPLRADRLT